VNATENRQYLAAQIASMIDHLVDSVESYVIAKNVLGPDNWRGTADLERVADIVAQAVATINNLPADDVREAAREIARNSTH
jgi:hypothetical protein